MININVISSRQKVDSNDFKKTEERVPSILYRFRLLFYSGAAISVLLVTALGIISFIALGQRQTGVAHGLSWLQSVTYIRAIVAIGTAIVLGIVAFLVYVVLNELNSRSRAYQHEHDLNQMKSKFITLASHEFRTPLSSILLSAALIEKYVQKADFDNLIKHARKIKQVVHRLEGILDDFLSLEKLNEEQIRANFTEFDLESLCRRALEEALKGAFPDQKISYEHSGGIATVFLDSELIKNALNHLLSNAVKYAGEDTDIRLHSKITAGHILISVIDNGVGIAQKDQDQLASTFYRVSESGTVPGTGLGLYLVKRYVDLMNGELHFYSEPGKETCFQMVFNITRKK